MQMTKNKTTSTKIRFFWPLSKVMLGAAGALLLGGFLLLQTETFAAPGDGPVVQYSFEDASNLGKDSSSAGNNATNNGATQTLGRVGKAAYFNGSNAALDLSAHASKLNLTEGTVSFWAKADVDVWDTAYLVPISWWGGSETTTLHWWYLSLGHFTFAFPDEQFSIINLRKGLGGALKLYTAVTRDSRSIRDGKWHAYTVTSNGGNDVKFYVDGEQKTLVLSPWANTWSEFLADNNGKLSVWSSVFESNKAEWAGMKWAIDELKIYNYARTAAQIKADYEQEAKPTVIIHYQNADGEELMSPTVHTKTSNGTEFQLGQTYYFDPDDLVSRADGGIYQKPEKQSVVFSQTERMKEITFVYPIKPMLVLHYTFDEGGSTVADSSQLETKNPGTVIGNYIWDEWGRVGGMYKKAQIMPWTGLGIRDVAAFTIGWWIKTTDKSHQNYFISNAGGADGYRFWISNGVPHFLLGNNEHVNPSIRAWWTENSCGVKDIADGNWHHLVWVFDAKGQKVTCYVDGVKDGERLLPRVYRQRKDIAPQIWGGGGYAYATHWNNSFLDDVRVYNYALSPQAVANLYNSYPAEENATTKVEITSDIEGPIYTSQRFQLNVKAFLGRRAKNLSLVVRLPWKLEGAVDYSFAPVNGESIVSGAITKMVVGTGILITVPLKNTVAGDIQWVIKAKYANAQTPHLYDGTSTVTLYKNQEVLNTAKVVQTVWTKPSVEFFKERGAKIGNNYNITYGFKIKTNYVRADGNIEFSHYNPAALFNAVIEIPLPPKAKFIESGHPNLTYDSVRHVLLIKYPFLHNHWYSEHRVILQYSGLTVWEQINFGQVTLKGNIASADGELHTQTYTTASESMEAEQSILNAWFTMRQWSVWNGGRYWNAGLINNHKWQDLFDIVMSNDGNTTVNNVSFSAEIPEWLEPYELTLPWSVALGEYGGTNYIKPIKFDYTTNKWVQKTIMGTPWAVYNRANLGLANDEYFTKIVFYFPEVKPWERIWSSNYYWISALRVRGDVKQVSGNLELKWVVKRQGAVDTPVTYNFTVNEKGYIPIYSIATTNRDTATQGDTVHMNVSIEPSWGFYYSNSRYLENPSEFILLPPGFQLDEQSFRGVFTRGSWQISKPRKVINARNVPAGWTVWRIDNTTKINWENTIIKYDFDIKLSDSVLPGTYDLEQNVFIGSDNPKYQVHWARWATTKDDPYGLWGDTTVNKLGWYYHQRKILTVTALNYGNAICHNSQLETSLHSACRESYKWDAIQYVSNYKSGNGGHYTTTLYNQWSPINNFVYTIEIPAAWELTSDGKTNDWRPTINSINGVVVSNAPAGTKVLYWYAENALSETFLPNTRFIQVRIPIFNSDQRPEIKINWTAPNFDDTSSLVYARAFISSYYTINGTKVPSRVIALRLVPSDYNPADDEKYALCRSQRRKNTYPAVSVRECEALIDLYRDTGGTNWREKTHWIEAVQFKPEKDYSESAVNVCKWRGIKCDGQWKIVGIELTNNNLTNKLSTSFKHLINLETLNLSDNPNFNAEFKQEFRSSLTKLKEINLSSTKTKNLNNLPENLEKLIAQKLTLREIPGLPTELKELDLSNGDLNAVQNISPFFQAGKLEKLLLQNSKLRGVMPTSVNFQTTIKEINLSNNQFSGKLPSWVKNLTSQKVKLNFSDNYFIWPFPDWNVTFQAGSEIIFKNNYIHTLFADPNFNHVKNQLGNSRNYAPQYKLVATADGSSQALSELPNIRENWDARSFLIKKQVFTSREWGRSTDFVSEVELTDIPDTNIEVGRRWKVWFTVTLKRWFVTQFKVQTKLTDGPEMTLTLKPSKDFQDENDPNKPQNQDKNMVWLTGQKNSLGTGLTFELKGKYLAQYFSAVHYSLWGNDIWWGFFWREVEDLANPVIISDGWTGTRTCYGRIRGFYYSSQRGERLWPLDQESKEQLKQLNPTYADLAMQWGRYTRCEGQENNIYGKIIHEYGAPTKKKYDLIAGVSYDIVRNKVSTPSALRCNFQRLNNAIPFGYIYDSAGGIGLLGASIKSNVMKLATADASVFSQIYNFHNAYLKELENWKCVSDIFDHDGTQPHYNEGSISGHSSQILDRLLDFGFGSAQTTLFRLWIRGIIWLSSELSNNNRGSIEGNQAITSLLLNTDTSIAGVINLARQRAEDLCRNRRQPIPMGYQQLDPATDVDILCYDGALNGSSNLLHVDHYDVGKHRKKRIGAIAVKNADVWLNHTQWHSAPPVNLFIDKGDLLLPASSLTGELQSFNSEGYLLPANVSFWSGDSKAAFLRGNFIVNGLILWKWAAWYSPIVNKVIVHGKVASYNTYTTPTIEKRDSIRWILEAGRTIDEAKLNFIGLDQLFTRSCNSARGVGSDWTTCEGVSADRWNSFITNKSFGLIDMDFSSPLFR